MLGGPRLLASRLWSLRSKVSDLTSKCYRLPRSNETPLHTKAAARSASTAAHIPSDNRYLKEGEVYEEPKPGIIEGTLITSGVIVERTPIILPALEQWETEYEHYKHFKEQSTGIKLPKDFEEGIHAKRRDSDRERTIASRPRITEEDIKKNNKSLYRALAEPIYLIFKVKQSIDSRIPPEVWRFPQSEWRTGETVRKTAERTLFYHAGENLKTYFLGNAPICHFTQEPSKERRKDFPQAKVIKSFYMHALYLNGVIDIEEDSDVIDYAWVRKSEFKDYFTDAESKPLLELAEKSLYYE